MGQQYLAEIRPFAGIRGAPEGWHLCDGSLLSIAEYSPLYSLIGTTYGGNGTSNFALPDLRGRLPIGAGTGPGLTNHPTGSIGGSEGVTLITEQMPEHTHAFTAIGGAASTDVPTDQLYADPTPAGFYTDTPDPDTGEETLKSDTVAVAGSSESHDNLMPSMAINYIIALTGIFPQRP